MSENYSYESILPIAPLKTICYNKIVMDLTTDPYERGVLLC